jgi:hypothetical protein
VGEPLGGGEGDFVSMAASGEPDPEVEERPGDGEEGADSVAISGELGPEVGEPPPTWPPLFASDSTAAAAPSRSRRVVVALP